MSLLEDIFLQDEADEAQELERVIEGDEYDDRPRSRSRTPNSDNDDPKEDEAEEEKRRVDPTSTKTKRVTKNPRFILNPARLTGPRGIQIIPDHFKDFKFKGKGHEKEDLDMVLKKLEHWAYRLYPKFQFEDCLKKIESLGKKRPVMVHLHKIRTDQYIAGDTVIQKDSDSDEDTQPRQEEDEFDKLLQQQIDLARATPAPGSAKKVLDTPMKDRSPFTMPKATSSPSISDEQKERMMRNRRLAEERRLARLKQTSTEKQDSTNSVINEIDETVESSVTPKKHKTNVIESSDDECDVTSVNQSVAVDIHNGSNRDKEVADSSVGPETEIHEDNDIDMVENVDNNDAIEIDQNVVGIIDDLPKNDEVALNNDKLSEIIEINVPTDANIRPNTITDEVIVLNDEKSKDFVEVPKVNSEIIEVNDENSKDFDTISKIADEVIEISDQVTDNISLTNNTDVNKNNNVDLLVDISNSTPTSDIQTNKEDTIEKLNNSSTNNDCTTKENSEPEIMSKQDNVVQGPETSLVNTNNVTEGLYDIMDVDFSDDF